MSSWKELYLLKSEGGSRYIKTEMNMLTFIGIKFPENYKGIYSILFHIYRCIIFFLGPSILISCLGDLYTVKGDWVLIGDDLCVIVGIGLIVYKYVIFYLRHNDIKDVIDKISLIYIKYEPNHDRYKYLPLQENYAIMDVVVTFFFHILAIAFFIVFVFIAPEKDSLPLRALFPFDWTKPYLYRLVYFYQSLGVFYGLATILTLDNIAGFCWHQISCNFYILGQEFKDMETYCNVQDGSDMICKMIKRLRILTMRHQYIIELAEQLNDITNPTLSAQVLASNFLLCLTGFEMSLTFNNKSVFLKFFLYMCAAMGQLLFWCIYGNEVQTHSETIVTMAYFNSSVCIDKTFLQQLKFVIMRAQRPIQMKASSVFSLCLQTFLSILRKSYSYFALLRTLNESQN